MKKVDKRKLNQWAGKYLNATNLRMMILFIPLLALLIRQILHHEFRLTDFLDTSILVSFLIVFVCEALATMLSHLIEIKTEDAMKLNDDYASLVERYSIEKPKMVRLGDTYIPVIVLAKRNVLDEPFVTSWVGDYENGNLKHYNLPKQLADNSEQLFAAHAHSDVYNNITIRMNELRVVENETNTSLEIHYGLTTYFDTLLSNRASDYPFKCSRTVREVYEPGPYICRLNESKMANHIGYTGLIRLSDGKIVFVRRGKKLSVGKDTWSTSISASLKTKYCMNESYELDEVGISNAIRMEILNELKISVATEINLADTIIAYYRDLAECGKPHFLFFLEVREFNQKSFMEHFRREMSSAEQRVENKKYQIVDGEQFDFFTIEELRQFTFKANGMFVSTNQNSKKSGKPIFYEMLPTAVASVVLLLNALKK